MTDETSDEHPGSHPTAQPRHDAPVQQAAPDLDAEVEPVAQAGARPRPGPGGPVAAAGEQPVSRRWFLAAGGATVLAGGAGVGAALLHGEPGRPRPNPPPATLLAAVAEEQALIADLDATTGGAATIRQVIAQVRADHAAHLQTLESLVSTYDPTPSASASASASGSATPSSVSRGTPRTAVALRAAELAASTHASARATSLDGRAAVLLASISACEAGHVELLR